MLQEIITYIILVITLIVALVRIVRFFASTQTKCDACSFSQSGCKVANLRKNMNYHAHRLPKITE